MPSTCGSAVSKRKERTNLKEEGECNFFDFTNKDPGLTDDADSYKNSKKRWRPTPDCNKWKQEFDNTLNKYIEDMINTLNHDPQREALARHKSRDKILMDYIQTTGNEVYLQNVLLQLFAVQDESCLEHVLSKHYVSDFGEAYPAFMRNNNDLNQKCYIIALQIMLVSLKDKLYGEFKFGKV